MSSNHNIKIPQFEKRDNAIFWLQSFNDATDVMGLTDKEKLQCVPSYFKSKYKNWFYASGFVNWNEFMEEFVERYGDKCDIDDLQIKLLDIKMKKDETIDDYYDRVMALRSKYRMLVKITSKESVKSSKTTGSKDEDKDDKDGSIPNDSDLEDKLLKRFIKGLRPTTLRHTIKSAKPDNLKAVRRLVKEIIDDSDSDESFSSDYDSDDDKSVDRSKSKKNIKETGTDPIESLTKGIERLTLLVQGQKNQTATQSFVKRCYNCQSVGHFAEFCDKPCKLCNEKHPYFRCKLYRSKKSNESNIPVVSNNNNPSSTLLVTECYITKRTRRTRSSDDNGRSDVNNHKSAKRPNTKRVEPVLINDDGDGEVEEDEGPNKVKKKGTTTWTDKVVDKLMDHASINISLNELATLSPTFRTLAKRKLTKNHKNKNKPNASLLAQINDSESDGDSSFGAPSTEVILNKYCKVGAILDGGSGINIISKKLVKFMDIKKIRSGGRTIKVADGRAVVPLGQVTIDVGFHGVYSTIEAEVLDGIDFDLLLGRPLLHKLGVITDYDKYQWIIRTDQVEREFTVKYHSRLKPTLIEESSSYSDSYDPSVDSDSTDDDSAVSSYLIMSDYSDSRDIVDNDSFGCDDLCNNTNIDDLSAAIFSSVDRAGLTKELGDDLKKILIENREAFGINYADIKTTNLVELNIDTGDHSPIALRPNYHMPYSEQALLKAEITEMVNNGILEPSMYNNGNSGWGFPALYVKKKDGDKRLCIQFQKLNDITRKDTWPLPRIQDLLDSFADAKFFSAIDLLKGFNQIRVNQESIPKLTVATPWGNFSYRVMPFGIKNGPSTFSRAIYFAMQPFLGDFVTTYIDDITIHSTDENDHLNHIDQVLKRIIETNLKIKPSKCQWYQNQINVLGFVVSDHGVKVDRSKINKINDFPVPKNTTDVRAFLNLCGFCRRHVQGFADIAAPLSKLTSSKIKFSWSDVEQKSFDNLKIALYNSAELAFPNEDGVYKVYTDASNVGLGVTLTITSGDHGERPVCFLSRKLQGAETRYPTVELELLAVVYAFSKLRKYILDKHVHLYTDNSAVRYLLHRSDPSSRLQRWLVLLQEFDFEVHHIQGKNNVIADVMSRYPINHDGNESDDEDNLWCMTVVTDKQLYEDYLFEIFNYLNGNVNGASAKVRNLSKYYVIKEDHLYRKVGDSLSKVPFLQERPKVLEEVHEGMGHFGRKATWSRLCHFYWWPGCYKDVVNHVTSCHVCQLFDKKKTKIINHNQISTYYVFERFGIDFVGPLHETRAGNKYILVAVEYFTNWAIAKPCAVATANVVMNFLYFDLFSVFGPPTELVSDNGKQFISEGIASFISLVNVNHKFSTPYNPRTNGKVEHLNGVLVTSLKKLVLNRPDDWDSALYAALYAHRTKVNDKLGISPYEALYGVPPRPYDEDQLRKLGSLYVDGTRQTTNTDKQLTGKDKSILHQKEWKLVYELDGFKIGDMVMKRYQNHKHKLDPAYKDHLFRILTIYDNGTAKLWDCVRIKEAKRLVNLRQLKKYCKRK